ncbi:MAG: hypothetical protein WC796_05340 [Candidatus Pacearchaeota archaeon]|jgi:hypothetical protein
MKTKIFLISVLICTMLVSVSAVEMGVSPSTLSFSGKTGEQMCKTITITANTPNFNLYAEDNWLPRFGNSKYLQDYTTTSTSLGIQMKYTKQLTFNDKITTDICLTGLKPGQYRGALVLKGAATAGVGVWLNVALTGDNLQPAQTNKVVTTGSTVKSSASRSSGSAFPLLISFVVSLIALIYLLSFNKKLRREREEKTDW